MGCLKKVTQILVLSFALIGFISIGGKDFLLSQIGKYSGMLLGTKEENISKLGDFSDVSEEFEIDKAASAFGYKGVLAEHSATGQKMLIVDSGRFPLITKEDFDKGRVEQKVEGLINKFKYQSIQVEDFEITTKGMMEAYGQEAPYVRFSAKINKLPLGTISGVISAVETENGDSRMLLSLNEKKKYSQLVTEEFFKKVK